MMDTFEQAIRKANANTVRANTIGKLKSGSKPRGMSIKGQLKKSREGVALAMNVPFSYKETGSKKRNTAMDNLANFGNAVNSIGDITNPSPSVSTSNSGARKRRPVQKKITTSGGTKRTGRPY